MDTVTYIVEKIDGDYAHLRNTETGDTILVAMALLPEETDEAVKLIWENYSYRLAEQ